MRKGGIFVGKIFRRVLIVIPAAALQVLWFVLLAKWLAPYSSVITALLSVTAFLLVLYIIIKRDETMYKLLWLMIILPAPLVGALLYLLFGNKRTAKPLKKRLDSVRKNNRPPALPIGRTAIDGDRRMQQTIRRLETETGYPLCPVGRADYYPLGDDMFPAMLADLQRAQRSIYLEYFIIEPGHMWDAIVRVLQQKIKQGVDVRILYDDFGSVSSFGFDNARELQRKGIPCTAFNPVLALHGTANYRDHRKMLIIDGRIAYSGGINLSDRYINLEHPYGQWKDTGFRLTGQAVRNFTHMFLTFWNAFAAGKEIEPPALPARKNSPVPQASDGYVLSYYDSPLNPRAVSNELYIDLLSQCTDRAWFFTPYLMLSDDLLAAVTSAARRGVDVRIIMPGIPDKKVIYRMSRSYYQVLLNEGVRIFEYTPGFVHAKSFVADDSVAVIGTVNLDYRSLFLHFENNSLFYRSGIVEKIAADFLATQAECREVTAYDKKHYALRWIADGILRIFSPLC